MIFRVLLLVLLFGLPLGLLLNRTEIQTDLAAFLPDSSDPIESALLERSHQGVASQLILAEITGGSPEERSELAHRLQGALSGNPLITHMTLGPDIRQLKRLESALFSYRMLLTDPPFPADQWSARSISEALQRRYESLVTEKGRLEERWVSADPLGYWSRFLEQLKTNTPIRIHNGQWVNQSGTAALVLIQIASSDLDVQRLETLANTIRATFDALPERRAHSLILGGPALLAVDANKAVSREASVLTIFNSAMVTLLLFFVYRDVRLLGLSLIPLFSGLIAGAIAVRLGHGTIHAITLGFGGTLLGVAADYPNHVFTHLTEGAPLRESVRRIWPTLRLGILTNVAGFGMMWFSGFRGLQELGLFAAAGLLAAGLATRWIIPALAPGNLSPPQRAIGAWLCPLDRYRARSGTIPFALTLLAALIFYGSGAPLFNDEIAGLNPVPKQRLEEDLKLQRDFGIADLRWMVRIEGSDLEAALELAEALRPTLVDLRTEGAIEQFELVTDVLPSQARQRRRREELPEPVILRQYFSDALMHAPFRAGAFEPFFKSLDQLPNLPFLTRAVLDGTPLALKADSLILNTATEVLLLVPLVGVDNPARIRELLKERNDPAIQLTDFGETFRRAIRTSRLDALLHLGIGIVLMTAILGFGLSSLERALRVLTPMLLASVSTAWLMAAAFGGLTVFHLASLLLVMGLSLDQALFFNREHRSREEHHRTLFALLICGLCSVLAFGGLAFSSITLLKAIGGTVATGALLAVGFAAALAKPSVDPR